MNLRTAVYRSMEAVLIVFIFVSLMMMVGAEFGYMLVEERERRR